MERARIETGVLEGQSANGLDISLVMVKLGADGKRGVVKTLDYGSDRFISVKKEVDVIRVEHDLDRGKIQDRESLDCVAEAHSQGLDTKVE